MKPMELVVVVVKKSVPGRGGGLPRGFNITRSSSSVRVLYVKGGLFWFLFPWVQARFTYM